MIRSVRLRLALWHTAAVGVVLLVFAGATYSYLARSSLRRTDRQLTEATEAFAVDVRAEVRSRADGMEVLRETTRNFRFADTRVLVFDTSDHLLAATPVDDRGAGLDAEPVRRAIHSGIVSASGFHTLPGPEGGTRIYVTGADAPVGRLRLAAAESLRPRQESLEGVLRTFALAIPLALLLAGLGGYVLARRSLAPVLLMSERAERIGADNPHERLPVPNPDDELGHLAGTFNGLLERLAGTIERQRRFMADAAHELRTPVAVMRGEADVALGRDTRPEHEYREALAVVRDEGRRLSRVVDDLFLLARADAGEYPLRPSELYLGDLLEECVHSARSLAEANGTDVRLDVGEEAPFRGDEGLLHRLVINLLDNALKYSPRGSRVDAVLRREDGNYRLSVRDTGEPIAAESRARIFERFHRGGVEGNQSGAGLGLSIARWIAEAHGGSLVLLPAHGNGNEFVLRLPAPPAEAAE